MTGFVLKLIAVLTMFIDHFGSAFGTIFDTSILRAIGRIAFPIYVYFIAEGCRHTRNIKKYLFRLGALAIISEIPFDLMLFSTSKNNIQVLEFGYQNVFFTLFFGVMAVYIYEKINNEQVKKNSAIYIIAIAICVLITSFEYINVAIAFVTIGVYFALVILLFVLFLIKDKSENKIKLALSSLLIVLITFLPTFLSTDYNSIGVIYIFLCYYFPKKYQRVLCILLMVFSLYHAAFSIINIMNMLGGTVAVVLLWFYNGKEGIKSKWFFYLFYPAHLLFLFILKYLFVLQ